jgi:citrate lyase subunit beta/citryl-CoA lyase
VHVLIETHGALRDVQAIAAHPRVQSLSFGLMDFVSAHRGAIPAAAMGVPGQFVHPLVLRAKLAVAASCHAHAKTPSHCVVTELNDLAVIGESARRAARELGYTRMWSIHPNQIRPIVQAFAPDAGDVLDAVEILDAAAAAHWAPVRHRTGSRNTLHDRASYRYYWQVLERAHRTGQPLPESVRARYFSGA